MKAAIIGMGAVGARVARQLVLAGQLDELRCHDIRHQKADQAVVSIGAPLVAVSSLEAAVHGVDVVICCNGGSHFAQAALALDSGAHAVSSAWGRNDILELTGLDQRARTARRHLVLGAGFSPGLTCVLARHFAESLDEVEEIDVARVGWGGEACRKQWPRGRGTRLASEGTEVRWNRPARSLRAFPEPVGLREVAPFEGAEVELLKSLFPGLDRCNARAARTRPTLRRKGEDDLGAVWVELRGRRGQARDVIVTGAVERPALGTAAVSALAALWAAQDRLGVPSAAGLGAKVDETAAFLRELADRGLRAAIFEPASIEG